MLIVQQGTASPVWIRVRGAMRSCGQDRCAAIWSPVTLVGVDPAPKMTATPEFGLWASWALNVVRSTMDASWLSPLSRTEIGVRVELQTASNRQSYVTAAASGMGRGAYIPAPGAHHYPLSNVSLQLPSRAEGPSGPPDLPAYRSFHTRRAQIRYKLSSSHASCACCQCSEPATIPPCTAVTSPAWCSGNGPRFTRRP